MAELQDKDKLTQEALALQKKLTDGNLTVDEKKRLEELKVLLRGGGKPETSGASGMHRSSDLRSRKATLHDQQHKVLNETGKSKTSQLTDTPKAHQLRSSEKVKFKVKSDVAVNKQKEPKTEEKTKQPEIKEAKVIEVPEKYERKSSYDIDDIKKKIDRLDSEGVDSLRDRYKEKYGEDLYVPDLHSDNVREALEDVKPYLEIDEFEEGEKAADSDEKEVEEDEEKKEKEVEDKGPSFFAKFIAAIKAFFKKIFSRKEKKEKKSAKVEDAAVAAVSNGE